MARIGTKMFKFKKIRRHKFKNRKVYQIRWGKPQVNVCGTCDSPNEDVDDRYIIIDPNQGYRELIETCIHENIHRCKFNLTEKDVDFMAGCITDFLFKIGIFKSK